MTLYLDTSALVKLYVSEKGSSTVRAWVEDAELVMTAVVTYAEARATFSRLHRVGALSASALRRVTAELDVSWSGYTLVDVRQSLVVRAGMLAERHALRGYDAIQLAAAL